MQNIFNFPKQMYDFIRMHKLYANLHALVIAMVLTVILMQAGSLFLLNYIPDHLAVIHLAYQEQSAMQLNLYRLENNLSGKSDYLNHQNVLDDSAYSWVKSQKDTGLAEAYEQLKITYQQYDNAISSGASKKIQINKCQLIISSYDTFLSTAEKDVHIKQSLVSLLQLVSLFLIFCIATSVMLTSWRVLINRFGKIIAGMPKEVTSFTVENQYNDELEELEKLVAVMSARFEAIQIETKWTNKNSTEKVRKMILAQDFLFKLTKLIGSSELNELAIKKTLTSLEQVLNVSNVALVFSESGSSITTQRALFSSAWPLSFDESMFDGAIAPTSISHSTKLIKTVCAVCHATVIKP